MINIKIELESEDGKEILQTLSFKGKWFIDPPLAELTPRILSLMNQIEMARKDFLIRERTSRLDKEKK